MANKERVRLTMKDGREVTTTVDELSELLEGRPPCLCGCGGTPKGKKSRFIPGHDARYHAAQKKAAAVAIEQLPPVTLPDGTIQEVVRDHRRTRRPAKAQDRPPAPSRRRAVKGDTSLEPGSEA